MLLTITAGNVLTGLAFLGVFTLFCCISLFIVVATHVPVPEKPLKENDDELF